LSSYKTNDKYLFVAGQLFLMGGSFLFNLVAAKLIGPRLMGEWQTISLISIYGMILTLGIINGMGRDVPYYRGKGDAAEISRTIATTILYLLAMMAVFLAVITLFSGILPDANKQIIVLGIVLLCARMVNSFSTILVRSFRDFRLLGLHQGFTALVMMMTIVLLYMYPGLYTVFCGIFLSLIVVMLFSRKYCYLRPWSRVSLRRLLSTGFPIYVVGLVFTLLTSIDRVLVLGFLGTEKLGIYTLATIAMAVLMMTPMLVSTVMYPKLAEHYGATRDISALVPMVKRAIQLNLLLVLPIAAVFLLVFYFHIVPVYLVAYLEGRNAMAIIMIAAIFLPLGSGFGDIFNVIGMQRIYLVNAVAGLLVNVCIGVLLVSQFGMGLEGAAIGTVSGLAVFTLLQVRAFLRLPAVGDSMPG